jgi:Na+/H+ antiporter NhaC
MADPVTMFFAQINQMGFYGFLLPWLFTFAVVYGLLMKLDIFGDVNKQVSVLLGIILAFFVSAAGGPQMATFFISLGASTSMLLAGILVILLFVGMFISLAGVKKDETFRMPGLNYILGFLVLLGVLLFLSSTGYTLGTFNLSSGTMGLIFVFIIILAAIWFAMSGGGSE